jgi:hypothetical protein
MDPQALVLLIPIAAIVMTGLVKIARIWAPVAQQQSLPATRHLEERLEAVEQELGQLRGNLSDTQERLDFAERVLAQSREGKRLPPSQPPD